MENIDFSLKKGETLGIIGATGAGKTTLIRLLLRLYDTDRGSVRLDGVNVDSMAMEDLHRRFGVVFQKDFLYADTLEENIAFGRKLSRASVYEASEHAQAESFIASLTDGMNHRLTPKGTNLSGGQKQRVLLSRALAGKPEILILDDSSSALDYKTDAELRKALFESYAETTTVMIAQRVSSIQHADAIMMLEEGKIIGYGTHEELMKSCPKYHDMYKNQSGGDQIA
ncbi:Lipid A export ATP-binding/permease protein MsbA [Alkalibacterium sp. AK22]|uniref:ATP-binding cassette domain-containing protein n=1 Tax=Alkalibacterium sp. AK22 TaxID=1229520 RepID=UPI0004486A49|nr:ABC transporter ATP-binding protein [Alkalibacterium sp. AK22]EXJ23537.1 Lipid A export ATP-binding/permease protein MsbA [Alkalibacterium sp. AK22]